MQVAKQIRLSRNCLRCSGVSIRCRPWIESIHLKQNSALARIDGMLLDGIERRFALGHVGDVVVEQGQVELDVQRLFVELARQVHPGFGGVDVLVQVEHQVVRHDRVAGREERHETATRGASRRASACDRRSTRSSEKSISSTVQVFLIASRYMSKNCGYRIGRNVRSKPGSRMFVGRRGAAGATGANVVGEGCPIGA